MIYSSKLSKWMASKAANWMIGLLYSINGKFLIVNVERTPKSPISRKFNNIKNENNI